MESLPAIPTHTITVGRSVVGVASAFDSEVEAMAEASPMSIQNNERGEVLVKRKA
jgi:hypothetical protein